MVRWPLLSPDPENYLQAILYEKVQIQAANGKDLVILTCTVFD